VADDPDIAARDRREIIALRLEGLAAAPAGEERRLGNGVERHLDLERRRPLIPAVPRNVHAAYRRERAEIVPDPLAVTGRRPARGEVGVERILWDVGILVSARDDRDRGKWRDDCCNRVGGRLGTGEIRAIARQQGSAGDERGFQQSEPLGQLELEWHGPGAPWVG